MLRKYLSIYVWAALAVAVPVGAAAEELRAQELRPLALALFGVIDAAGDDEIADPRAKLGRALFWDKRLSKNGMTACADCHAAENGGADNAPRSRDARGHLTKRHSQSIFNTQAAEAGLRWTGDRASGAAQAMGSITGSMGFDAREDLIPALKDAGYGPQFAAAFPGAQDALRADTYADALQAYQMTLRTPAAFDRWLAGDAAALDAQQLQGLRTFIDLGCAACHSGPLLGGNSLQKFGAFEDYRPLTGSTGEDLGVMETTRQEADRDVFRVQPLRNVAKTAPYFHDGSVATLDDAIRIMARTQLGLTLTNTQTRELVAFLGALSGEIPAHYRP